MKRNELVELRKLYNEEVNRRRRISKLISNELVKEYLELDNIKIKNYDSENFKEILERILKKFEVTDTNGIYVCTGTYYTDCCINYEETDYYVKAVSFDSKDAEYREYRDIEDKRWRKAYVKKEYVNIPDYDLIVTDFEREYCIKSI